MSGYKHPVTSEKQWTEADLPPALRAALEAAIDRKARCPAVLRINEIAGYTDFVLLVSGRSERHVRGITDGILDALTKLKIEPMGTDGLSAHTWDLLDYDDFLVHVFFHPVRGFYDLERMWSDAPRVALTLPDEVFDDSDLLGLVPPDLMPGFRGSSEFGGFADEFDDGRDAPPTQRLNNPDPVPDPEPDPSEGDDSLFDE